LRMTLPHKSRVHGNRGICGSFSLTNPEFFATTEFSDSVV
jgi:hypothetical protein